MAVDNCDICGKPVKRGMARQYAFGAVYHVDHRHCIGRANGYDEAVSKLRSEREHRHDIRMLEMSKGLRKMNESTMRKLEEKIAKYNGKD